MCVCECVRLRVCAGQEKRGTTGHFRKEGRVWGGVGMYAWSIAGRGRDEGDFGWFGAEWGGVGEAEM